MDPLLRTKTHIPVVRTQVIPRPRLAECLGLGLSRRLTLISAPAGFGKTTLVAAWARTASCPVAWLSLDEGDSDPVRFVAYLSAALQQADPRLGGEGVTLSETTTSSQLRRAVASRINEIDLLGADIVLVLDDYHLISTTAVHDLVTGLLDHIPANLHLFILSRADPPLPLARFRARGQLVELRAYDLRFSEEEAAVFLREVMALELGPEDVASLAGRTEGWAGGLQMAALSMQGRGDPSALVRAFTGSHRYVMDYLLEEVLEQQPDRVQRFLLRTSILDQLSGPLCDAVCELTDSQSMLVSLERANLFILPLDDRREWYRYHRLFADLLRQRLGRLCPDAVQELHRRASRWYAEKGLISDAIDHALAGQDFATAADLVADVAQATLAHGEVVTFLAWAEAFPESVLRQRPTLAIYRAWALFWGGRPIDEIEAWLPDAVGLTDREVAQVAAMRALVALYGGVSQEAVHQTRKALHLLAPDDVLFRGVIALLSVLAPLSEGDPYAGGELLADVAEESAAAGNPLAAVFALSALGDLHVRQARLHEAERDYQRALSLATDGLGCLLPAAGQALMGLGAVAWMQHRIPAAQETLTQGIALARKAGEIVALDGFVTLARVHWVLGEPTQAHACIADALRIAQHFDVTTIDDWIVRMEQARLWVLGGDLDAARGWAVDCGLLGSEPGRALSAMDGRLRKYGLMVVACLHLAEGRCDQALAALDEAQTGLEVRGRVAALVELLVLRTLAYECRRDRPHALDALDRALTLAEPGEYVQPFVEAGVDLLPVLREAIGERTAGFAARIVAILSQTLDVQIALATSAPGRTPTAALLAEPLTQRELEVLRLLPSQLTSAEIAQHLYVAPTTARTHIKSIYSKLAVHSREEAVDCARALGLI